MAQVLQQCLEKGDREVWDKFVRLAQPVIAAAVIRTLSAKSSFKRELTEDLIQEIFLKLLDDDFRRLRRFRGNESRALGAYLRIIAANFVKNELVDYRPAESLEDLPVQPATEERNPEHVDLVSQVKRCLDGVDARNQRIFWLCHGDGMRPREIAALPDIGLRQGGVETVLFKLTLRVRECLRRGGLGGPEFSEGGGG